MKQKKGIYEKFIKRALDFLLSLFALIVLSPLLLFIAILIRLKLGNPILFTQNRPGENEKVFKIYKFRTMTDETDENAELLPNSIRLTKFGKFLRSTSLDELPELFNILKGDMSLIGPRPLLIEYLPLYDKRQRRRHETRPGLSGLAQVKGRNSITWEDKFEYDIEYVDNISFTLDLKLIFQTLFKVFRREDINNSDSVTVERFRGTKKSI